MILAILLFLFVTTIIDTTDYGSKSSFTDSFKLYVFGGMGAMQELFKGMHFGVN